MVPVAPRHFAFERSAAAELIVSIAPVFGIASSSIRLLNRTSLFEMVSGVSFSFTPDSE